MASHASGQCLCHSHFCFVPARSVVCHFRHQDCMNHLAKKKATMQIQGHAWLPINVFKPHTVSNVFKPWWLPIFFANHTMFPTCCFDLQAFWLPILPSHNGFPCCRLLRYDHTRHHQTFFSHTIFLGGAISKAKLPRAPISCIHRHGSQEGPSSGGAHHGH